jgi:antitoxin ParD1/3/4
MAKSVNLQINDETASFIEGRIAAGHYKSAQACFDEALAGFLHNEAKRDRLHELLEEGLNSGPAVPFDMNEILSGVRVQAQRAA